jgi:electron transfer flavoprotein alpha subunit
MFQGKLVAEVAPQGDGPAIVSCQIGAFRADAVARGARRRAHVSVPLDAPSRQTVERRSRRRARRWISARPNASSPSGAGSKAQDQIAVAEKLAAAMGAEMAASRPICDNGWLPMDPARSGSSGQTVAPKLYVALGISGAIQHLVGMKGSRTIVAINKDAGRTDLRSRRLRHRRRSVRDRAGPDAELEKPR